MMSRDSKLAFYFIAGPILRLSGAAYRLTRAPRHGQARAHLGPGQKKYLKGWINVDANAFTGKCDVWADLRNPLPFHDASLDAVYSHHMIEHLPRIHGHMAEVYRCLKPGGVYRLAGPNGDAAIAKFVSGSVEWFGDWPDSRASIGGRLENFIFCRGEHTTILTKSFLCETMSDAGFRDIAQRLPVRETGWPDLFSDALATEEEDDFDFPHTLVMEGVKPR